MLSLSIVIPVYNSEESLEPLLEALSKTLPTLTHTYEVILVEDDSLDNSWQAIQELLPQYTFLRAFKLMRNYGQHNALLCGIRAAQYDIIVTMDDDLQHPPEEISKLLAKLSEGYDVVYGRPQKERHNLFRNLASQVTKAVLQGAMGAETARNISAFRVFRTPLRRAFDDFRGPFVNIDVLLTWGSKSFANIPVRHEKRLGGQSNYTFSRLVVHTFNMVTGFSTLPLQIASMVGFTLTAFGIVLLFYLIVIRILIFGYDVPGFTFLATMIAIFSGSQMFMLGIIGEYLARMHFRTMDRPAYIVREAVEDNQPKSTQQETVDT